MIEVGRTGLSNTLLMHGPVVLDDVDAPGRGVGRRECCASAKAADHRPVAAGADGARGLDLGHAPVWARLVPGEHLDLLALREDAKWLQPVVGYDAGDECDGLQPARASR